MPRIIRQDKLADARTCPKCTRVFSYVRKKDNMVVCRCCRHEFPGVSRIDLLRGLYND